MFTYLLIACELAVLYTVFWYLYVRNPRSKCHISANMWGSYQEPLTRNGADPTLQFANNDYDLEISEQGSSLPDSFTNLNEKFIWDAAANHYVPVSQGASGAFLFQLAAKLDQTFSQLNVRQ